MDAHVRQQSTIRRPARLSGRGYWSGATVDVEFRPAGPDEGITFVRADLVDQPRIRASIHNRINGPRRTTLRQNGKSVAMVEHILAALAGLQIDNCEVWVNREEMPGCDGSSKQFVDVLQHAERVELDVTRNVITIDSIIQVGDDKSWIRCEPCCTTALEIHYQLDYWQPSIGQQEHSLILSPANFLNDVASARTFLLESEANLLREQGQGLDVRFDELLVFGEDGPIQNRLRFTNECARHKVLDMIGDLALIGTDIHGRFSAYRSGHRLNAMMAIAILEHLKTKLPDQTTTDVEHRKSA